MKRRRVGLATALIAGLAALLLAGVALAAGESIPRGVVSSGGGALGGAGVQLRAVVGQPLVGAVSGGAWLCSGLICGGGAPDALAPNEAQVYLPLTWR